MTNKLAFRVFQLTSRLINIFEALGINEKINIGVNHKPMYPILNTKAERIAKHDQTWPNIESSVGAWVPSGMEGSQKLIFVKESCKI